MIFLTYVYILLKAVGSTMGVFKGEVYGFKAPKLNFYYSKAKYLENRTKGNAKAPSEIQNSPILYGYETRPGEMGVREYTAPGLGFAAGIRGELNFGNFLF